MPGNVLSSFYQTITAAKSEAAQLLAPTWKATDSIYLDYAPDVATIGQTLNVPIPADPTNNIQDVQAGDYQISDINFTTTSIVFNRHPLFSFVIRDYEQFNSAQNIRTLFMDAAMKGMKNYINAAVTALFTTGNFTTNAAISTTAHLISTAQALSGAAVLSDQKVPVADDPLNMSLLVPSTPYYAIVGDSNWTQAQIAGMYTAEKVRATGVMPTAYGWTIKLDQQMPTTGAAPSRTFTGMLMHRWSIAMATRPLPKPDEKVVDYMYENFFGLPVRIILGYNQYPKLGYVVTVDAGFGLKVVRENMAQLYTIAE